MHNLCSGVPLKNQKTKARIFFAIDSGHRISIFRRFFFQQISCPIIGRNGKKVHKVRMQRFVWQTNLRLQCKLLSPRPYLPIGHGWHMWSGGTCLGNPRKSFGFGDGQYIHPLPWSGPMFFESFMEKGFNLSSPFPRPLINAQIHPNSQKRVKTC